MASASNVVDIQYTPEVLECMGDSPSKDMSDSNRNHQESSQENIKPNGQTDLKYSTTDSQSDTNQGKNYLKSRLENPLQTDYKQKLCINLIAFEKPLEKLSKTSDIKKNVQPLKMSNSELPLKKREVIKPFFLETTDATKENQPPVCDEATATEVTQFSLHEEKEPTEVTQPSFHEKTRSTKEIQPHVHDETNSTEVIQLSVHEQTEPTEVTHTLVHEETRSSEVSQLPVNDETNSAEVTQLLVHEETKPSEVTQLSIHDETKSTEEIQPHVHQENGSIELSKFTVHEETGPTKIIQPSDPERTVSTEIIQSNFPKENGYTEYIQIEISQESDQSGRVDTDISKDIATSKVIQPDALEEMESTVLIKAAFSEESFASEVVQPVLSKGRVSTNIVIPAVPAENISTKLFQQANSEADISEVIKPTNCELNGSDALEPKNFEVNGSNKVIQPTSSEVKELTAVIGKTHSEAKESPKIIQSTSSELNGSAKVIQPADLEVIESTEIIHTAKSEETLLNNVIESLLDFMETGSKKDPIYTSTRKDQISQNVMNLSEVRRVSSGRICDNECFVNDMKNYSPFLDNEFKNGNIFFVRGASCCGHAIECPSPLTEPIFPDFKMPPIPIDTNIATGDSQSKANFSLTDFKMPAKPINDSFSTGDSLSPAVPKDKLIKISLCRLLSSLVDWINTGLDKIFNRPKTDNISGLIEYTDKKLLYGLTVLKQMDKHVLTLLKAVAGLPDPPLLLEQSGPGNLLRDRLNEAGSKVRFSVERLKVEITSDYDKFVKFCRIDKESTKEDLDNNQLEAMTLNIISNSFVKVSENYSSLKLEVLKFRNLIQDFYLDINYYL